MQINKNALNNELATKQKSTPPINFGTIAIHAGIQPQRWDMNQVIIFSINEIIAY